jgi:hypothetical protein
VLGLGEGELQLFRQGPREVIAADRHVPLPDPVAIGDDEVGIVGADVEQDDRVLRAAPLDLVEADEVVQGDRAHLDDVHLDSRNGQRQDGPVDLVALHREQTDLGHGEVLVVDLVVATDLLVGPDHLIEREGDLLLGLELDDVGDPLLLHGGQLDKLHQPRLPGHADGDFAPFQIISIRERRQGFPDELVGIRVRLAKDLRILDEVKCLGHDLLGRLAGDKLQCLESGLADVDCPDSLNLRHAIRLLPSVRGRKSTRARDDVSVPVRCGSNGRNGPGSGR